MSNYILRSDLVQGSDAWHEWRKGKMSASKIAAVMGKSPYTTRLQEWEATKFGVVKEKTAAMQRGNDLEDPARRALIASLGDLYQFEPICVESTMYPWMIASLDGFFIDSQDKVWACEIKCPGKRDHMTAMLGAAPEHYMPQLQHTHLPSLSGWYVLLFI